VHANSHRAKLTKSTYNTIILIWPRRAEIDFGPTNTPEAKAVRGRIEAKLKSIGLNDPGLKDAYETWYALE